MDLQILPLEERIAMDAAGAMALGAFAFVPDEPVQAQEDPVPAAEAEPAESGARSAVDGLREVLGVPDEAQSEDAETASGQGERDPRFDDLRLQPLQLGEDALLDLDGRLDLMAGEAGDGA
jgi:hypothetical protein